jgi:hypothetical protein
MLVPQQAGAQTSAVPENSRTVAYGKGWNCQHGVREERGLCAMVAIPANSYLTSSGNDWECNRLYRRVDGVCVAVLPEHAFAEDSSDGQGWRCEQGYRETTETCAAVQVPPNAYALDSSYGVPAR